MPCSVTFDPVLDSRKFLRRIRGIVVLRCRVVRGVLAVVVVRRVRRRVEERLLGGLRGRWLMR